MRNLEGRVAVITGAGSGIGRALAIELAGAGARLALSDIDEAGLQHTLDHLQRQHPQCQARGYALDVSEREAVFAHADTVRADFGTAHLLFNNAGVALFASVNNMTMDEFDWLMGINLYGVVHGTKAFLPMMLDQNEGHIVNISSVLGLLAAPAASAYVTSKFAVRGFTETLSRELRGTRVQTSCVHPGGIKTNIGSQGRLGLHAGDYEQEQLKKANRLLTTSPADLAQAIVKGVQKGRTRILAGNASGAIDAISRLFPSRYAGILERLGV